MTQILTANIGGYPRLGETKDQQRHRRALAHFQTGQLSKHAFRDVEQSVTQEIIREQIEDGLDEITDGLVTWTDPITHFCKKCSGIRFTSLKRYFDLNFYYRHPTIDKKSKKTRPFLLAEYEFAKKVSSQPLRVILTGPYTLARHTASTFKPLSNFKARLSFFTDILREELIQLTQQGAKIIQIDEPSIGTAPHDFALLHKSAEALVHDLPHARIIMAFYYTPLAPLFSDLMTLPVDVIHLDFTYDGKKLLEKIQKSSIKKSLGFGMISGRNTRLEPIDPIITSIRDHIKANKPAMVYLSPSSSLEHLPRKNAREKIRLLSKIKSELATVREGAQ
jgi:5-methyltetrahydropteroyltriglutamate--homocysteine methyltransferase